MLTPILRSKIKDRCPLGQVLVGRAFQPTDCYWADFLSALHEAARRIWISRTRPTLSGWRQRKSPRDQGSQRHLIGDRECLFRPEPSHRATTSTFSDQRAISNIGNCWNERSAEKKIPDSDSPSPESPVSGKAGPDGVRFTAWTAGSWGRRFSWRRDYLSYTLSHQTCKRNPVFLISFALQPALVYEYVSQ